MSPRPKQPDDLANPISSTATIPTTSTTTITIAIAVSITPIITITITTAPYVQARGCGGRVPAYEPPRAAPPRNGLRPLGRSRPETMSASSELTASVLVPADLNVVSDVKNATSAHADKLAAARTQDELCVRDKDYEHSGHAAPARD